LFLSASAIRTKGLDQRNSSNNESLTVGMNFSLPKQQEIVLLLDGDSDIVNGFRTGRKPILRSQKGF
jgi:hypothetical protein